MRDKNLIVMQAEQDAGGVLKLVPDARCDPDKIMFVDKYGRVVAKVTVAVWEAPPGETAEMILETIDFIQRKKRGVSVDGMFFHPSATDAMNRAMAIVADPEGQLITEEEEEEEEEEEDGDDADEFD